MDYHSLIEHTSNGSQRVFALPFPYIKQADVYAYRIPADPAQQPEPIAFTWQDPNSIQLTEAVASGLKIRIQRQTLRTSPHVTFKDVALIAGKYLDLSQTQLLFLIQEATDGMLMNGATLRDVAGELQELREEDARLDNLITQLQSLINAERSERQAADAELHTRISAEAAARQEAISLLASSKVDAAEYSAFRDTVNTRLASMQTALDGKMPKAPENGGPYLGKGGQWLPQSLQIGDPFIKDSQDYAILIDRPAYLPNAAWNIGPDYLTLSDAAVPGDADSIFIVDSDGYLILG